MSDLDDLQDALQEFKSLYAILAPLCELTIEYSRDKHAAMIFAMEEFAFSLMGDIQELGGIVHDCELKRRIGFR